MCFFFFKQKTAYEMRISDWSSDVCSSDLVAAVKAVREATGMSLKDAHDLVRAHANRPGGARVDASGRVEFEFPPAAAAAVARGELVEAIALLPAANPQPSLTNARDAVEHFRRGALPTADQPAEQVLSESPPDRQRAPPGKRASIRLHLRDT